MTDSDDIVDWRDEIAAGRGITEHGPPSAAPNGLLRAGGVLLAAFCFFNILLTQTGFAAHGIIAAVNHAFENIRDAVAQLLIAPFALGVSSAAAATIADALIAAVVIVAISIRTRADAEYDGHPSEADPILGFLMVGFLLIAALRLTFGLDWFVSSNVQTTLATYLPVMMWCFVVAVIGVYAFTARAPATTSISLVNNSVFTALVTLTFVLLNATL